MWLAAPLGDLPILCLKWASEVGTANNIIKINYVSTLNCQKVVEKISSQ